MEGVREKRSPVPDLLFEEERDARVEDIAALLEEPERVDASTPLHRITVFVTYRCNLDCPYCKTIARSEEELTARPEKRKSYDLASFARMLEAHGATPIRHLHFTGGEASLVPDLPDMVRLAKARGVERVSMTTNGTLPPARYLALVEAGLDELRVSLDAADPELGQALTQRRAAWGKAVRALEALGEARRGGAPFFLIVNTVVGRENWRELPNIVRFVLGFRPDDVKLITDVDARGSFADADTVRTEVEALLATRPPDELPLLRRKLRTVFAPDAIGLETVRQARPAAQTRWRCYVPLTERTVDGVGYYPCSVYLREGGAPIGELTDSPDAQRAKTAAFVRDSDCLTDPICRRYCLHCTRSFNDAANRRRP